MKTLKTIEITEEQAREFFPDLPIEDMGKKAKPQVKISALNEFGKKKKHSLYIGVSSLVERVEGYTMELSVPYTPCVRLAFAQPLTDSQISKALPNLWQALKAKIASLNLPVNHPYNNI